MSATQAAIQLARQTAREKVWDMLAIARRDTDGSRRMAGVLLSLWNGQEFRCDLQDVLSLDPHRVVQICWLLDYLVYSGDQLDTLIGEADIRPVIEQWAETFQVPAVVR